MKKVTLRDIAEATGVSQNTVSQALRNSPSVKKETRNEILRAARALGYPITQGDQQPKNICIFTKSDYLTDSIFYSELRNELETKLRGFGYGLVVNNILGAAPSDDHLQTFFATNHIRGNIVLGDVPLALVRPVLASPLPVITAGCYYNDYQTYSVVEDNLAALNMIVAELHSRGYRDIGFFGNPNDYLAYAERYMGFLGAMHAHQLRVHPDWLITDYSPHHTEPADETVQRLRGLPALPEAFVCASDRTACVMARALADLGLSIPDDIAITGFDNSSLAHEMTPRLFTVEPHNKLQADRSVRLLLELIEGEKAPPYRITVLSDLVPGDTVAKRVPHRKKSMK